MMGNDSLIRVRPGVVKQVKRRGAGITEILAEVEGEIQPAINYDMLTGEVREGDRVVLNTTAVSLKLGTGGYHFVIWNTSTQTQEVSAKGHIMKLRYTPLQVKCLSVEEQYRERIEGFKSLNNMPVIVGTLHSMVAAAAAGVKQLAPTAKIAYLMTDRAALPIAFSNLIAELKAKKLIDALITCGQAFGGDYEAVNIYTGLIAAKEVVQADVSIISMGPGSIGTHTKYGFTAIEQGELVNAVNLLGGTPIAIPRISFADYRKRHYGVSHHTITALSEVALTPAVITIPKLPPQQKQLVLQRLKNAGIDQCHNIVIEDGQPAMAMLKEAGIEVKTMGRSIEEDLAFFLAAGASGVYAGKLLIKRKAAD